MNEAEMESALLDVVREWFEDLPLRDEGYLNALLNVIQRMCIGQFAEMQVREIGCFYYIFPHDVCNRYIVVGVSKNC